MSCIEFYVRSVVRTPAGETLVVGVPNDGQALSVGDRFASKYEVGRDDVMTGTPNPSRVNGHAVDLVVESIDVMRVAVQQVQHGVPTRASRYCYGNVGSWPVADNG